MYEINNLPIKMRRVLNFRHRDHDYLTQVVLSTIMFDCQIPVFSEEEVAKSAGSLFSTLEG